MTLLLLIIVKNGEGEIIRGRRQLCGVIATFHWPELLFLLKEEVQSVPTPNTTMFLGKEVLWK